MEGLETRLRVVEVPLEDNSTRFEKVENQTAALKFPIKDLYDKLDQFEAKQSTRKENTDQSIAVLEKAIDMGISKL